MAPRIAGKVAGDDVVIIAVDARPTTAMVGESVATALLAAGVRAFHPSAVRGEPRGPFCMMGVCQECLVEIDGRVAQACMVAVRADMKIRTMLP
jgi:predicted molibdopterin-dependent oxidoreductase YjgC